MKNISAAIVAVINEVHAAPKTGRVQGRGSSYSYASDADLILAVRPEMAKHGLCLIPTKHEWVKSNTPPGKEGKSDVLLLLKCTWLLVHTSGESLTIETSGEGADRRDKSSYKAQTGALKYALRSIFLLPVLDDAERQTDKAEGAKAAQRANAQMRAERAEVKAQQDEQNFRNAVREKLCIPLERFVEIAAEIEQRDIVLDSISLEQKKRLYSKVRQYLNEVSK